MALPRQAVFEVPQVDLTLARVGGRRPAPQENTYWKLISLRGAPVQPAEKRREPHLILQAPHRRVAGSGGCNRLMGGYTLDGDRLKLSNLATTMMACPQGMGVEQPFLEALGQVQGWRMADERLELLDVQGAVLAEFASRAMK